MFLILIMGSRQRVPGRYVKGALLPRTGRSWSHDQSANLSGLGADASLACPSSSLSTSSSVTAKKISRYFQMLLPDRCSKQCHKYTKPSAPNRVRLYSGDIKL